MEESGRVVASFPSTRQRRRLPVAHATAPCLRLVVRRRLFLVRQAASFRAATRVAATGRTSHKQRRRRTIATRFAEERRTQVFALALRGEEKKPGPIFLSGRKWASAGAFAFDKQQHASQATQMLIAQFNCQKITSHKHQL